MSQITTHKFSNSKKQFDESNNQLKEHLNQFLNLKVTRAVDRLLMENDVQYVFKIYAHLQQTVKQNTSQLRQVLYQKHQNLINCSDMIDKLNFFTEKIKDVQQKIDEITKQKLDEEDLFSNKQKNPIQIVQNLMTKKHFLDAFRKCKYFLKQCKQTRQSDRYYLNFIKLEIMDSLQEYLLLSSLTPELITEMILTLKQFLSFTQLDQLKEISANQKADRQNQYESLIDLLNDKHQQKNIELTNQKQKISTQQQRGYQLSQLDSNDLLQVIFKFKLFSLNKQAKYQSMLLSKQLKHKYKYQRIFSFFNDLNHLLSQNYSKSNAKEKQIDLNTISKDQTNNLNAIFKSNIKKVMHNLSQIFIGSLNSQNESSSKKNINMQNKKTMPILSFQYELYQQLLNDRAFMTIIQSLSAKFFQSESSQENLEYHLRTLWYDYYRQFLQLICEQVNPLSYQGVFPTRKQCSDEFLPFLTNNCIRITYEKLKQYDQKMESFVKNIHELMKKSQNEKDFMEILEYLRKILQSLNEKVKKYTQQFYNSFVNQQKLREYLLIILCCQIFNSKIYDYFQSQQRFNLKNQIFTLSLRISNDQFFNSVLQFFSKQKQKALNVQQFQLKMDGFFGLYYFQKLKDIECKKLKQIILKIIKKKLDILKNS